MGLLFSFNCALKYLLCVINVLTKQIYVKPLMNKKAKKVLNDFIRIINEYKCKPNKLWVDEGREFYKTLMQKRLDENHIFMHLTIQ